MLLGAYAVQALVMAATSVALLAGSPPALVYVLAALTAMALTVAHPAYAVVSPGLAHTTEQLVALNAVTGWVLSIGLVLGPALAGAILAFSTPGVVYLAGALALTISTLLMLPLHGLVPPLSCHRRHGRPPRGRRARALPDRCHRTRRDAEPVPDVAQQRLEGDTLPTRD